MLCFGFLLTNEKQAPKSRVRPQNQLQIGGCYSRYLTCLGDSWIFGRPEAVKGFFPEELEGADDLGGGLAGHLFFGLEVEAVVAELLGADQVGGFGEVLADVVDGGVVGLFGAEADGQQGQVRGEGV